MDGCVAVDVTGCRRNPVEQECDCAEPALKGAAGLGVLRVGGIPTVRATRVQLAERMLLDCKLARRGRLVTPRLVFSSNGAVIANFHRNRDFRALIDQADLVDADGMPLVLVSRLLCREPLPERVATTDFIWDAAAAGARSGLRFYFVGGEHRVAVKAASRLREIHPSLDVVGIQHGYFEEAETDRICQDVVDRRTDVLWVGLGSPRQELFAVKNRSKLGGVGWIRTCGGLYDHLAERFPRAPLWMQAIGLEWLHRAFREPRRLGPRYLITNPLAALHLLTKTSS